MGGVKGQAPVESCRTSKAGTLFHNSSWAVLLANTLTLDRDRSRSKSGVPTRTPWSKTDASAWKGDSTCSVGRADMNEPGTGRTQLSSQRVLHVVQAVARPRATIPHPQATAQGLKTPLLTAQDTHGTKGDLRSNTKGIASDKNSSVYGRRIPIGYALGPRALLVGSIWPSLEVSGLAFDR